MLSHNPFEEIELHWKKRPVFLEKLFLLALSQGLSVAIIARDQGKKHRDLVAARYEKQCLYPVTGSAQAPQAAALVARIKPWHRASFCIILCDEFVVQELIDNPPLLQKSIPDVEEQCVGTVFGYLFPLDDLLVSYGDATGEQIIRESMSSYHAND